MPEIRIGSTFDDKGFKKASKSTSALEKNVKRLGVSLLAAFSVRAIVNFGKASVRASLQAQAEQDRLNQLLTVGVGATASQVAALNDQASALEKLGVVTAGNITQTQSQLATFNLQTSTIEALTPAILDYVTAEKGATASTSDFKQMTNGLAQALNGNFSSLTRVGFVIDENTKKQIKSGNESERAQAIIEVLNSTYKDFNANLRNTDSGKMQILANTAKEVQTIIGVGIIDSLKLLSEDNTIDSLTVKMRELATAIADVTIGFSLFIKDFRAGLEADPILGSFFGWLLDDIGSGIIFEKAGKERRERLAYNKNEHRAKQQILKIDTKADKLSKTQLSTAKKLAATQKQIAAEKKKQEVLDKAALLLAQGQKVFDEEGIQLAAAAQGKLTEEERARLALKTDIYNLEAAINEGNITAAAKLANSMVANAQKLAALRTDMIGLNDIQNPFNAWLLTIQQMAYELSQLAMIKPITNTSAAAFFTPEQQATADRLTEATNKITRKIQGDLEDRMAALQEARERIERKISVDTIGTSAAPASYGAGGSMGGTSVVVNVAGSVSTERDLVSAITQGLYAQQASGTPVTYSTVY